MIRRLGSTLAIVLLVCTAPQARGQTVAAVDSGGPLPSPALRVSTRGNAVERIEPYGGFGLETMQTPFLGAVIVDRFGMVHATPFAQRPRRPSPPSGRG